MLIKLIIFDLCETLLGRDIEKSRTRNLIKCFNLEQEKEKVSRLVSEVYHIKKDKTLDEMGFELCERLGIKPTKENLDLVKKIEEDLNSSFYIYDHVEKMLDSLKSQGFKLGFITNMSVFLYEELSEEFPHFFGIFDYKIFSFEVGMIKPDPRIYKLMLDMAKVSENESLMVGDSETNDFLVPKSLGMNAILFDGNYENLKKSFEQFGIYIN